MGQSKKPWQILVWFVVSCAFTAKVLVPSTKTKTTIKTFKTNNRITESNVINSATTSFARIPPTDKFHAKSFVGFSQQNCANTFHQNEINLIDNYIKKQNRIANSVNKNQT